MVGGEVSGSVVAHDAAESHIQKISGGRFVRREIEGGGAGHSGVREERRGVVGHSLFRIKRQAAGNGIKAERQLGRGSIKEEWRSGSRAAERQIIRCRSQIGDGSPVGPLGRTGAAGVGDPGEVAGCFRERENVAVQPRRSVGDVQIRFGDGAVGDLAGLDR